MFLQNQNKFLKKNYPNKSFCSLFLKPSYKNSLPNTFIFIKYLKTLFGSLT